MDKIAKELLLVLPTLAGNFLDHFYLGSRSTAQNGIQPLPQEIKIVLIGMLQLLQGFAVVAFAGIGNEPGLVGSDAGFSDKRLLYVIRVQGRNLYQLAAGKDSRKDSAFIFGNQNKQGIGRRFLYQFQELVAFLAEIFRHPKHQDLIATLKAFEVEFADNVVAFVGRNVSLFVLGTNKLQPVEYIAIRVLLYKLPPFY